MNKWLSIGYMNISYKYVICTTEIFSNKYF